MTLTWRFPICPGSFLAFDDPGGVGAGPDGTGDPVGGAPMGVFPTGKLPTLDHAGEAFPLAGPLDFHLIPDLKNIDPDFIAHLIRQVARGRKFLQMGHGGQSLFSQNAPGSAY